MNLGRPSKSLIWDALTSFRNCLCGGDKRSQKADIKTAKAFWRDYEQRTRTSGRSR